MYIEAVPNRNSPPAILLRESYRVGGKVKKRTLLNLRTWPPALVEGSLLKGGTVLRRANRPLRGEAEIALKVGAVIGKYKMAKHVTLTITDLAFARKQDEIEAEARLDGST